MPGFVTVEYLESIPPVFPTPDYSNRVDVLDGNGTWTATADGYIQRQCEVTNCSNWYKVLLTVNGVVANTFEVPGCLGSGIYDYASPVMPVKSGDVVSITLTYSTGTTVNYDTLYYLPVR